MPDGSPARRRLSTRLAPALVAGALLACAHDVVLGDYGPPADAPPVASGGSAESPGAGGVGSSGPTHASGGWHAAGGYGAGGWFSMGGDDSQADDEFDEGGPGQPGPEDGSGSGLGPSDS